MPIIYTFFISVNIGTFPEIPPVVYEKKGTSQPLPENPFTFVFVLSYFSRLSSA